MERLVRREHQGQMPLEQPAVGNEPPLQPVAARAPFRQDRVHRLAEVPRQLADQRLDEEGDGQALAPERRARAAGHFGHALERQPLPTPFT